MRRHFLGNLDSAHVAGLLDHAFDGQPTIVVGVTDGEAAQAETAGGSVNHGLRFHAARLKRHGHGDGLHRRAWLEGVSHRPVAQLLASEIVALVRDVARVVGQRQHLARDGVEHDYTASFGLVGNHGIAKLLVGKKLHFAVNAELDVLAFDGRHLLANAFHHTAQSVLDDTARASLARQILVEGQFHPFLAVVFNIGESHDVRNRFTFGVLALVLLALVDALDAQGMDFLRHRLIHLPLDPDKGLVFVAQLFFQIGQWHFQQFGQFGKLRRTGLDILGNGPDA